MYSDYTSVCKHHWKRNSISIIGIYCSRIRLDISHFLSIYYGKLRLPVSDNKSIKKRLYICQFYFYIFCCLFFKLILEGQSRLYRQVFGIQLCAMGSKIPIGVHFWVARLHDSRMHIVHSYSYTKCQHFSIQFIFKDQRRILISQ